MPVYMLAFIIAAGVALLLTPGVICLAGKTGAMDAPDARKVHKKPIPRIGGIGIYLAFMVAILSVLAFTEFLAIPATIFWLVGLTNTVNLIDGLDGLAAGVSTIASITIFLVALQQGIILVAVLTAALAGAAFGFLYYNFNPAKIFMGDSGSQFLGFMLAGISVIGAVKSAATIALIVPILALGLPILDTTFAIVRRYRGGVPIFKPDKGHLHHRLLDLGFSQRQAVLLMYVISALLGLSAVALTEVSTQIAIAIVCVVVAVVLFGAKKLGIFHMKDSAHQH